MSNKTKQREGCLGNIIGVRRRFEDTHDPPFCPSKKPAQEEDEGFTNPQIDSKRNNSETDSTDESPENC